MPPSAPASTIAGSTQRRLAAVRTRSATPPPQIAPSDELALGADVPDVGAVADREPDADQHQRRRLEQQFADAVEVARPAVTKNAWNAASGFVPERREQHEADDARSAPPRSAATASAIRRDGCGARAQAGAASRASASPPARASPAAPGATRRSSAGRSPRRWCRASACAATAAPARSPRCGRRSRTARRAPRRSPGPRRRRRAGRSAPGGSARAAPTSTPQVGCATISTFGLPAGSRGRR